MPTERVNPALLLKAAEMARPIQYNEEGDEWFIDKHGLICRVILTEPYYVLFDPLTSDADAWALERALKKEGWDFGYWPELGFYIARPVTEIYQPLKDKSDTLLLLKCVSAQFNIPMGAVL